MHHWNDDEYLLFMEELNEHKIKKEIKQEENENKEQAKDKKSQKKKSTEIESMDNLIDNKRREILEQKLKEIYMSSNELKDLTKKFKLLPNNISIEVEKLLNNYKEKMNNWKIVKLFYGLFENLIEQYLMEDKNEDEKKYNFLYKFLQYDEQTDQDKILYNRVAEIHEIITKIDKPTEAIKEHFYPQFKEIVKEIEPLLSEKDNDLIQELLKGLENFIKSFDNIELKNMIMIPDNFCIWVKELLKMNCFLKINEAENEAMKDNSTRKFLNVYRKYSDYKEMIEPLLDKGIVVEGKATQKRVSFTGDTYNHYFNINESLYEVDPNKIKYLKIK
jgi:hypothetical protein